MIVPARDEAKRLPRLLSSLQPQMATGDELIVVDDASTDSTIEVAREYGVRLVAAGPLPGGWLGKPHACWQGSRLARNDWLLFVDADTALSQGAVAATLGYAAKQRLDALSLLARQDLGSLWERLLVPFAYRHYFAGHGARPTLNGQFILISRPAYEAVGGHAAVRAEVAEDVALAVALERWGLPYELVDGRRWLAVRMYNSLPAIVAGFGKNSTAFLAQRPLSGVLTAASTTLALVPYWLALRGKNRLVRLAALLATALDIASARRFQRSLTLQQATTESLLQPLAGVVFLAIAGRSLLGRWLKPTWKGQRLS